MLERTDHEQRLIALGKVLDQLLAQQQIDTLLAVSLQFLQAHFDYSLIWLARYEHDHKTLTGLAGSFSRDPQTSLPQTPIRVLPGDCFDQVLVTGQTVIVPSLQQEARVGEWKKLAHQLDLQGALIFGLKAGSQVNGILMLGSPRWGGTPRAADVACLEILVSTLGNAWNQLQQQRTATPERLMAEALAQMTHTSSLEEKLTIILQQLFDNLQPVQTSFFWFDAERQKFWQRLVYRSSKERRYSNLPKGRVEFSLEDIQDYYLRWQRAELLCHGQSEILAIGLEQETSSPKAAAHLLQALKRRALLMATVVHGEQLLGFVVAEMSSQRTWSDKDQALMNAAAQLAHVITAPELRNDASQANLNRRSSRFANQRFSNQRRSLIEEINQVIAQSQDWSMTRQEILKQVGRHLQVPRAVLLRYDRYTLRFHVDCQFHGPNRSLPLNGLPPLSEVDLNLLHRSDQAIAIHNLEQDLRFLAWRQCLWDEGIRAMIVTRILREDQLDRVLLVGVTATRSWKTSECEALEQVTAALEQSERGQQQQQQQQQQQHTTALLHAALDHLHHQFPLEQVIAATVDHLGELMNIPFATLLLWDADDTEAQVAACYSTLSGVKISLPPSLSRIGDPILHAVMQLAPPVIEAETWTGIQSFAISELTPDLHWLSQSLLDQVLVMPLRDSLAQAPMGAIVFGVTEDQTWETIPLKAACLIVRRLAHHYYSERCRHQFLEQQAQLECLNWYKYRQIEQIGQQLSANEAQILQHQSQLSNAFTDNNDRTQWQRMLRTENWQLAIDEQPVPVLSLLTEVLSRIEPLTKQRQLSTQVHNLSGQTSPLGVNPKLALIIYELLLSACYRSQPSQRIDLWCRLSNSQILELSITDQGHFNPLLIEELNQCNCPQRPTALCNSNAPSSTLSEPPGLHLRACQTLMKHLGGQLEIAKLEDGRVLSRLLVPIQAEESCSNV